MSLSHRRVTAQNLAKLVQSFLDMYVKTINVIVFFLLLNLLSIFTHSMSMLWVFCQFSCATYLRVNLLGPQKVNF